MTRKENWEEILSDFILARKSEPFVWGANDCALFAADAIQAITGEDVAADFRGQYTTELGAFKAIKTVTGGSTVADAAAYCAGKSDMSEWFHPLMAQRGDLVVIEDADGLIAGVVHTNGRDAISVGEDGLKRFPISAIQRAWHY